MRRTPAAFALLLAPACLLAQDEDGVVVSATRSPRPSLEVPASVDRVYGEELRDGRPQVNLSETLGRVPGIVVQNRQNYAQDLQISSRGFGARSTFGVRGIRIIVDGIPASMPDGQGQAATIPLGSTRSIEVLRGPFSSLYGNAAGGVIVAQSEDGPESPTIEANAFAGGYGSRRAALKFGGTWGVLNGIVDASRFETDGYRRHSAAVRDQINAKARVRMSEDTSLTLVANGLRQPDAQDPGGLTRAQVEQDPRQVRAQVLQFNARKTTLQDQTGLTLAHRLSPDTRAEATLYYGERRVEQFLPFNPNAVINLDRDYGGGALRAFHDAQWLGRRLQLAFGAEHERAVDRRRGFDNANGVPAALTRDEDNRMFSNGQFVQAEWHAAERWRLHAGLRRTSVRFRNDDYFVGNQDDSGNRAYRATTPAAGVAFLASKTTALYASVGRGFETPTFLELANRPGATGLNFELEASRSRHAEAGVKTVLARWRLNAAVFDVVTSNEIVVDQNVGGRATFKNVGHTDRRGLELSAESVGTGPWEARAAYTFLEAEYRDAFTTGVVAVPSGSMIPGVPRHLLYGSLGYRRAPFVAQLEGIRKSRVAVNDLNSEFADAYTVLNLMAGLVQEGERWRLMEFVRLDNLSDRNYVGSVIVNEGNGRYYEPSSRRSMLLGLQASLRF
ncbi:MAG TPA: TonB-dependent receptor [Burkholderiales bacterium]|nr:TonB-dependent receptor [Burkholderiales bacterium]